MSPAPPTAERPPAEIIHPLSRTLSQLDNTWYTLLTLNSANHFDLELGRQKEFGQVLMNSTFTLAVSLGIIAGDLPGLLLSIDNVKLTAPLFGGDSLYLRSEAGPSEGARRVRSTGFNQNGVKVIEIDQTIQPGGAESLAGQLAAAAAAAPQLPADRAYKAQIDGPALEDFSVGDRYHHGRGRTMLADESIWIGLISMNRDPAFFDQAYARKAGLQDLLVDRGFILSTILGLSVKHTTQRAVANLGWRDARFHHPVFPGDTLYSETEVLGVRPSASRPGQGIVDVRTVGLNQRGEMVASYDRSFLTYARTHPDRDRVGTPASLLAQTGAI